MTDKRRREMGQRGDRSKREREEWEGGAGAGGSYDIILGLRFGAVEKLGLVMSLFPVVSAQ